MAGTGTAPKPADQRRNRSEPERGHIRYAPGVGWQHGRRPPCPPGLGDAAKTAWATWFDAWFAAFWTKDDIPALRLVIKLYDKVDAGAITAQGELRLQMDTYGITPKGQQDRRWRPPKDEDQPTGGKRPADELGARRERKQVKL